MLSSRDPWSKPYTWRRRHRRRSLWKRSWLRHLRRLLRRRSSSSSRPPNTYGFVATGCGVKAGMRGWAVIGSCHLSVVSYGLNPAGSAGTGATFSSRVPGETPHRRSMSRWSSSRRPMLTSISCYRRLHPQGRNMSSPSPRPITSGYGDTGFGAKGGTNGLPVVGNCRPDPASSGSNRAGNIRIAGMCSSPAHGETGRQMHRYAQSLNPA